MKKHKFDIVHVHTPIASVVGRLAAKWARVPVVIYTVHGFFFHERMAPWKRWILIKIESFLGRYFTSFMFTVSGEDRASALQFKMLGADRIFWVKNGVDLQNFQSAPVLDLRREFGIPPEDRVICFIGRLVREKGIQDLLEALTIIRKKRSDFKLLIVGETLKSDRDHSASEIFRAYIQKNNLEKNVIFTGFRDDIPQILGSVDLFVLPSHREGMPQTILEAMAAGRPVVATNIRGCREEVIDGVTGALVRVVDPIDLAEKIHKILFNPQLAREMGLAGRKRVENEFDEDIVLSRQVEIYRDFVAREKSIFS